MPRAVYKTISIPEEMFNEIERVIKVRQDLGYQTVTEFIKDAIRRRLEEIKKEMVLESS
mgnify:FL=1